MVNRVLIRVKVIQILFACSKHEMPSLKEVSDELERSIEQSYKLYHYMLSLMGAITDLHAQRLDQAQSKYMPSEEERNPNLRMVNNRFIATLMANTSLNDYCEKNGVTWAESRDIVRIMLNEILSSQIYADYLASDDCFDTDKLFWRACFKEIIAKSEEMENELEEMSIYWNDDAEVINTFVIKTIKRIQSTTKPTDPLLPVAHNGEDIEFANRLLHKSLVNVAEYDELIDSHLKNWDSERIADMDRLILRAAIAEMIYFDSIPLTVTFNEYIDIAKSYSTPKSGIFVNGILDAVAAALKKEGRLPLAKLGSNV